MRHGLPDPNRRNAAGTLLGNEGGEQAVRIDWPHWIAIIERKRRALGRLAGHRHLPPDYFLHATLSSFRLEGLEIVAQQAIDALRPGAAKMAVRGRLTQRVRNHAAILMAIDRAARRGRNLTWPMLVRWYTSISSGLSITSLDEATTARLDSVVRRINSPQLRLQSALMEVARLHAQILADPFFPSFNGILARLLLEYHLGRCALPPVVFDADMDATVFSSESRLLSRMLERLDGSFDRILMNGNNGKH